MVILDFYSVKSLVRRMVGRIGKLGRDVVKSGETLDYQSSSSFSFLGYQPL
jgi:hypothetical protein